jgi:hypothetical protein
VARNYNVLVEWMNRSAWSVVIALSVGGTSPSDILCIEGLFTQGLQPGWTVGESVGGIFEMDSADWSYEIRHHVFDTRSDTEFKGKPPAGPAPYPPGVRLVAVAVAPPPAEVNVRHMRQRQLCAHRPHPRVHRQPQRQAFPV